MKHYMLGLTIFLFGLVIAFVSIWRSQPSVVTLAADSTDSVMQESVETPAMDVRGEDEYPLLYPGLLPDHPLYFLKMVRDRIQLWLTRDPLARAQMLLSFADKRVASSLALAEKGKAGLAASTATKAELYLEQSAEEAQKAAERGVDVSEFYSTYSRASRKHEQVLLGVLSRVPQEARDSVEQSLEKSRRGYERAAQAQTRMQTETEPFDEAQDKTETEE